MIPLLVDTNSIPRLYAGKNCLSQFRNSFFLTPYLGVIIPHLFILANNCILNLPILLSSINSNSPIYRYFCITLRISLANLEVGITKHSFFLLISLLYKVLNKFETIFNDGI